MKKTRKAGTAGDELRAEYEFDYAKGRKNRFASGSPTVAVVLEPDVARVFGSSAKVNRLLRSVIKAVPGTSGVANDERAKTYQPSPSQVRRSSPSGRARKPKRDR